MACMLNAALCGCKIRLSCAPPKLPHRLNLNRAVSPNIAGAVADGRPAHPRAFEPVPQRGLVRRSIEPEQSPGPPREARLGKDGSMEASSLASMCQRTVWTWPCARTERVFAVERNGIGLADLCSGSSLVAARSSLEATGGFETVSRRPWRRGPAGCRRQSSPGPRLCQGPRPARQDRSDRRRRDRPFRRGNQAEPRPLPDEATRLLADLVARRRQIIEMIGAEASASGARRQALKKSIARLARRSRRNSPASMATSTTPCAARRPGATRRTSSPPCPASARPSRAR